MSEKLCNILYAWRKKKSYMDVDRSLRVEKDSIHAQRIEKACPPTSLPSFQTLLLSLAFVPGIV